MSLKYKQYWFTIIEVIIAASILWITVFWILNLINFNSNQANLFYKEKLKNDIFLNSKECIKKIWYDFFKNNIWTWISINFWDDNNLCLTWSYDNNLSFTWIIFKSFLKNKEVWEDEFWNYAISGTWWDNYINITNYITDWINKRKFEFKLTK
jgi:hypothetical protein